MEQELGNGWAEGVFPEDLDRDALKYIYRLLKNVKFLKWNTGSGGTMVRIGGYLIAAYHSMMITETSPATSAVASISRKMSKPED